ncbi:hypothetical protein CDCA_CDCA10G2962 [Cyanidium caldarium]|uniref:V-type proton ATPase subunit F n=1 Tax=Cyanidium caldarium TaxID=2771 RepID=A0AAV9IXC2_CYACA|nr:hypothetical protein CDCA_CDCA10G2962 [Cyanidium caldarium]
MSATISRGLDRPHEWLMAVIGDEDTVTGFLLAGIGDASGGAHNFLVVRRGSTSDEDIADAFRRFTAARADVGIVLITQSAANRIRHLVSEYRQAMPAVLEIPSKDEPYDAAQDSTLQRVRALLGIRER